MPNQPAPITVASVTYAMATGACDTEAMRAAIAALPSELGELKSGLQYYATRSRASHVASEAWCDAALGAITTLEARAAALEARHTASLADLVRKDQEIERLTTAVAVARAEERERISDNLQSRANAELIMRDNARLAREAETAIMHGDRALAFVEAARFVRALPDGEG